MEKENKVSKIIGYVVSFLWLILCLYITLEVINANNNNRPPRLFGYSVSYVPTNSMENEIMAGEYILFVKTTFDDVNENEIVVYRANDGKYIVHRVIEKHEDYLIVKGDNNIAPDDEHVTKDMVYGKYIMVVGFMSVFSNGIDKNLIFFILVIIFVCMMAMQAFSIFVKGKTDEIKKNNEDQKELLREQMRKQILEEELARLREENKRLSEKNNE